MRGSKKPAIVDAAIVELRLRSNIMAAQRLLAEGGTVSIGGRVIARDPSTRRITGLRVTEVLVRHG